MSETIPKKTHQKSDWNLEFEYPATWIVNTCLGDAFQVHHASPVNGWRPNVEFKMVESSTLQISEVIEELLPTLRASTKDFSLIDKKIKKGGDQRGGVLYQHRDGTVSLISQKVLVPIGNNKILTITSTTESSSWQQFAPLIKLIVSSARSKQTATPNSADLEIVYADAPAFGAKQPTKPAAPGLPGMPAENRSNPRKASSAPVVQQDFATFAKTFDRQWSRCLIADELVEILQDVDIAKVLWAALGSKIKCWISDPLPALDNQSVLGNVRSLKGQRKVKQLLSKLNDQADNLISIAKQSSALDMTEIDPAEKLSMLDELLAVGPERQDWEWSSEVNQLISETELYAPDRSYATAATGFVFYWLLTHPPTDFKLGRRVQIAQLMPEILTHEAGLAIAGTNGGVRAYRYGDCLLYSQEGRWYHPRWDPLPWNSLVKVGSDPTLFGPPSDTLLLPKAQQYLKEKLRSFGVKKPAVVVGYDPRKKPAYLLLINLLDGKVSNHEEINHAMDILHWATPPFAGIIPCLAKDFPTFGLEL